MLDYKDVVLLRRLVNAHGKGMKEYEELVCKLDADIAYYDAYLKEYGRVPTKYQRFLKSARQ